MTQLLIGSGPGSDGSDYEASAARLLDRFFTVSEPTKIQPRHVDSAALRGILAIGRIRALELDRPVEFAVIDGEPELFWTVRHEPVTDEAGPGPVEVDPGLDEDGRPLPGSDPAAIVRWLLNVLGASESAVIQAADIERAYRYFKKGKTAELRSETRTKLWALARSVRVMHDYLGADLKSWFLTDGNHVKLLKERRWDELRQLAVEEAARQGRLSYPTAYGATRERYDQVGFGQD